jgi:DNA-nicking Smr family endonuclease
VKPPRGLTAEEAGAWARVAATVEAMPGKAAPRVVEAASSRARAKAQPPAPLPVDKARAPATLPRKPDRPSESPGLDSHWDRRFRAGAIEPEFTLDLHGHTLDSAHARLDAGLGQAKAMGARVVLLIAGKARPSAAADRAVTRGAIRAKLLDWLAAGPHGADIAAIRPAHRRHGGEGALYLVLRRPRSA